jgi:hypothetical protein
MSLMVAISESSGNNITGGGCVIVRNLTPYIGELTRKLEDGTEAHSKKLFGSRGQRLVAHRVAHPPAGGRGDGQRAAASSGGMAVAHELSS